MTDTIALIISLIVISGVTAYVGDLLGTYIGKKRLSLFGTRPKRTGQIIGIGAGMAIALMTLGVSALVFRGAVRTIFNAQSVSQRLAELEVQEKSLSGQVASLEGQMMTTTEQLEQAKITIAEAEQQRLVAEAERDTAKEEVIALAEQRTTLDTESKKLQTTLETLRTQFTNATSKLIEAEDKLANIQDELASADEQRDDAVAEAKQATDAAAEATQQVAELKTQIGTVQADLEIKSTELTAQIEALAAAETNLVAAQTNLETAQADLATATESRDLALQERDTAQAQMRSLEDTKEALNNSLQELMRELPRLEAQTEELATQNTNLTVQNQDLLKESFSLSEANASLKTDNETLTNDIKVQNEQAELLRGQVAGLNTQLEEQARELEIVTEQMRAVNSGELTYSINEAIHNGVISSQDPLEIRAELAQLFLAANNKTTQRGAGPIEPRTEQLETLVQAISESPNADIITLRSPYNQFGSAPVTVDVEAIENQRLVGQGQLVVSRQIHLGSDLLRVTSDEVSGKVRELMREANDKLLSLGLADNVDTSAPDGSSLSAEAFSSDLERLTGVVTIGLVATDEVFSSGPVKLSLVIIN